MISLLQFFDQLHLVSFISAGVFGAIIGVERESRDKGAGLRTHTLVSLGACLFTLVSLEMSEVFGCDPSRIAAQIVSGIGFLGGGAILQEKDKVRGLTTAATIWITAAIGMSCGLNQILQGFIAATFTLLFLFCFRALSKKVRKPRLTWLIGLNFAQNLSAKDFIELEEKLEQSLFQTNFKLLELTEKSADKIEFIIKGQGKLSALIKDIKHLSKIPVEIELQEF